MSYRDDRAALRSKVEELEGLVAELGDTVRRLEVAAASGPLRGISDDVADELIALRERVGRIEQRLGLEPGAPAAGGAGDPVASSPTSIRSLVDAELGGLSGKKR